MKSSSSSEGSLREFISSLGSAPRIVAVLILGAVLLIFGSINLGEDKKMGEEDRIAEMCSMTEGVGECRAVVTYSEDGERVYAVALFCEGADSVEVRKRLTETVCSLYGIGAHRVSVIRLSK